jgi:hypothetical protein
VGTGTLLTIIGSVSQGSNALREIQVLDGDGTILQRYSATQGAFRVDLSNFGSLGRKVLRFRAVDSAGLSAETTIQVVNDDALLDQNAREFLRRYSCAGGGTERFGDLEDGPYSKPVRIFIISSELNQYEALIKKAADFWTKYCGIAFQVFEYDGSHIDFPYILLEAKFAEDPPQIVAETRRGFIGNKIVSGDITLYKGWLDEPDSAKIEALAHELGHALLTASEVEEYGPYMVMWPFVGDIQWTILPPIVQKAVRLLYSNPPAWTP